MTKFVIIGRVFVMDWAGETGWIMLSRRASDALEFTDAQCKDIMGSPGMNTATCLSHEQMADFMLAELEGREWKLQSDILQDS